MASMAIGGGFKPLNGGGINSFMNRVNQIKPAVPPPVAQPTAVPPPAVIPPTAAPVSQPAPQWNQPAPVLKAPQAPPEFKPQAPTFGPGNNLIGQQISAPSAGANSYDSQAAQYAQNANVQGYSGQTDEARNMILAQLKNLQNAPDRFALAQSNYDQFQKDADPAYQQQLRGVGQKAAAFGRIGAGMTTNDLTGALGQHQNLLSGERTRGINEALSNTLQDRLNISGALNAGGGLLGGQDLSLNTARSNAALGQSNAFSGLGQNQYNREYNNTQQQNNQQRYQADMDQNNIQNQIAQQKLQQGAQEQAWRQQYDMQRMQADIAAQQNTQFPGQGQSGYSSSQLGYDSGY